LEKRDEPRIEEVGEEDWKAHREAPRREFEDFVFDKHVRGGNRNREFWLDVSSQVENEVFVVPSVFRDIYYGKKAAEKTGKESDYELVVRCQLVCTASKTDTVMAKKKEEFMFLKGSFPDDKVPAKFVELQALKRARGIPAVNARVEWLVPDRWASTPLGVRNKLDGARAYPFLVCPALFPIESLKVETRKGVKWPIGHDFLHLFCNQPVVKIVIVFLVLEPNGLEV
jgi:hypothetical protein